MKLTDQEFEALKASLNNAIHEIVVTCQHLENDHFAQAAQALMTAQDTLDRVADEIVKIGG